jgi:glutamine cyclotransferase
MADPAGPAMDSGLNELEFIKGKIYANVFAAGSNRSHSTGFR